MNHILLDIEALGTRPGCAVIELAAVAFDLATGKTGAEFHRRLKPIEQFTATLSTLAWHADPKRLTLIDHPQAIHPREAILQFLDWLDDRVFGDPKDRVFWSWGTTYDFPILEPVLDLRNPEDAHPWKYHQIRDARTVWQLAFGDLRHPPRPHIALEDCRLAIADLVNAHRELTAGRDIVERLLAWDEEHVEQIDLPPAAGRQLFQILATAREIAPLTGKEGA